MAGMMATHDVNDIDTIDIERFIKLVRSHAILWDINCDDYKNRRKRELAWVSIAQQLFTNYNDEYEKEQIEIVKRISTKWRSIRDAHLRSEKKRSICSNGHRYGRYVYARYLSFLPTHTELAALQSTESDEEEVPCTNHKKFCAAIETDITPETRCRIATKGDATMIPKEEDPLKLDVEADDPVLQLIKQTVVKKNGPDQDESFFNSVLPIVRQFTDDQRLAFRIEVLNIIKRIKNYNANSHVHL